jgi:hypothetical protein
MDAGLRTLNDVFVSFRLNDRWSVRSGRGFTWLPHERAQRIWATEATPWHGVQVSRLVAESPLFVGKDGDREELTSLSWLGANATTSGLVVEHGAVSLRCSVLVYEDNQEWASRVFQVAALVQAMEAQQVAADIAASLGYEPTVEVHPDSGRRTKPDPILSSLTDRAVWAGQHRWTKRDFTRAIGWLNQYGIRAVEGPSGLVAEFPFGASGVNLLRVNKERHPQLGWGVRMKLTLDGWPVRPLGTGLLPVELNAMEHDTWDSGHVIGSWAVDRDGASPYFTCFLPSALYQPEFLEEAITWTGERSMWVSHYLERRHADDLASAAAR